MEVGANLKKVSEVILFLPVQDVIFIAEQKLILQVLFFFLIVIFYFYFIYYFVNCVLILFPLNML